MGTQVCLVIAIVLCVCVVGGRWELIMPGRRGEGEGERSAPKAA